MTEVTKLVSFFTQAELKIIWYRALADLGVFRGGDFGNPSERSERTLRGVLAYGRMKFHVCEHFRVTVEIGFFKYQFFARKKL